MHMVLISFAPSWFYGYDIALELLFAVVSLIVAALAFKIYKKTAQKNVGLFGLSFTFVGTSYIIQSILNFLILSEINQNICTAIKIESVNVFNQFGLLVHILFMTIGLCILTYITFKHEKKRLLSNSNNSDQHGNSCTTCRH